MHALYLVIAAGTSTTATLMARHLPDGVNRSCIHALSFAVLALCVVVALTS